MVSGRVSSSVGGGPKSLVRLMSIGSKDGALPRLLGAVLGIGSVAIVVIDTCSCCLLVGGNNEISAR
jgi:hypothetical protein